MWSAAIVDIPRGFALCDGTNNTPDLRDRFLVGAGGGFTPDETAGTASHDHSMTTDLHRHAFSFIDNDLEGGLVFDEDVTFETDTAITDETNAPPPFYSLAYVMRL